MRVLTFVLILGVVGCGKAHSPDVVLTGECRTYVSPYMVEYPDSSLRKSDVQACPGVLKASALDGSGETESAGTLTVSLIDTTTHLPYLTTFTGD